MEVDAVEKFYIERLKMISNLAMEAFVKQKGEN